MVEKITVELQFNEQEGKFCIVNHDSEQYIKTLDFGAEFEVFENDNWIKTCLSISTNEKNEMIFVLKNTSYSGMLDGVKVRI